MIKKITLIKTTTLRLILIARSLNAQGLAWNSTAPILKPDGVMEIGRYIDFHEISNDGSDFSHTLSSNSGKLMSSSSFQSANEIVSNGGGYSQFRAIGGNYGLMLRNDGAYSHFLITSSGDVYGGWNGLRPFTINNVTGNVHMANVTL